MCMCVCVYVAEIIQSQKDSVGVSYPVSIEIVANQFFQREWKNILCTCGNKLKMGCGFMFQHTSKIVCSMIFLVNPFEKSFIDAII